MSRIQEYLQSSGLAQRHQRLYSLLDRLRLATAPGSRGPSPPVTSHPLDGDGPLALETMVPDKDWYLRLVKSQCWTRSDSALLEGAELVNRLPPSDMSTFMMNSEFNLSLLAPCLGLGMREVSGGQRSPLFEAARLATLDRVTSLVQQLPVAHHVFQPFLPVEATAYWNKLNDLFGDAMLYRSLTTLARALAQYLLVFPKLPSHLHLPPEKERDTVKFVVMTLEALAWHLIHEQIPLSLDLQAGLDCCCLALQLPSLWSTLSSPEMVTHACSLIHCVRFVLEAVVVQPGDQLLSPERRMNIPKASRENEIDSDTQSLGTPVFVFRPGVHHRSLCNGGRDGGVFVIGVSLGAQKEQQHPCVSHISAQEHHHQPGSLTPRQQLHTRAPLGLEARMVAQARRGLWHSLP